MCWGRARASCNNFTNALKQGLTTAHMVWEDIVDKYAAHGAYMTGYMTFRTGSYDLLPHILTTKKTNCLMPTLITLGYALSGEMAV